MVDGATSKNLNISNEKTTGQLVAELIKEAINNFPKKINLEETVSRLTKKVYKYYKNNNLIEDVKANPSKRLTASTIIYSNYLDEIWMIGDCKCIVNNENHTNKKYIDKITSEARSLYIETELLTGKTIEELMEHDTGREYIKPLLKKQTLLQNNLNSQYGFEVIDGFEVKRDSIKKIKRKNEYKNIILASDGYPKLYDSLDKSEEELKKAIKDDPLLYKTYKSTKGVMENQISFDDRAYLKIQVD